MENKQQNNDLEDAIGVLLSKVCGVHRKHRVAYVEKVSNSIDMNCANKAFDEYMQALDSNNSTEILDAALQRYITARKYITKNILKDDAKKWDDVLQKNDAKIS